MTLSQSADAVAQGTDVHRRLLGCFCGPPRAACEVPQAGLAKGHRGPALDCQECRGGHQPGDGRSLCEPDPDTDLGSIRYPRCFDDRWRNRQVPRMLLWVLPLSGCPVYGTAVRGRQRKEMPFRRRPVPSSTGARRVLLLSVSPCMRSPREACTAVTNHVVDGSLQDQSALLWIAFSSASPRARDHRAKPARQRLPTWKMSRAGPTTVTIR